MNKTINGNGIGYPILQPGQPTPAALLKILLVMKLTAVYMLLFSLTAWANVKAQKINLAVRNTPFQTVIQQVQKQSGYSFSINERHMRTSGPVTLNIQNKDLSEALGVIFRDQPFGYRVDGKIIISVDKNKDARGMGEDKTSQSGQDQIRGRVTDENGEPLVQATIKVKGTDVITRTNSDGDFVLASEYENSMLEISYVGFSSQNIRAVNSLTIKLERSISTLDETVVIGYGKTTRRLNTGSVSRITAEDIKNQPVSNPLAALSGRIPGVVVTQSSGVAGSRINVEVQGRNNLGTGTVAEPLYIIDGVPFAPNNEATSTLGSTQLSPFALINPTDIESIEVLKDADATAIYGSRGAYGVVLITTKKGTAGKTVVNASLNIGINKVTRLIDILNTEQYLDMRREAFRNDNVVPDLFNAPDLLNYDQMGYTDWQKELIGSSSSLTDAQLSFSGGSGNTQFLLSGGYLKENLVFKNTNPYYRGSTHFNLNHQSENQKFSMMLSGSYGANTNNTNVTDLTNLSLVLPPNYPNVVTDDGSLIWEFDGEPLYYGNPLSYTKEDYRAKMNSLNSNLLLNYTIVKGLTSKVSLGYNTVNTHETHLMPQESKDPRYMPEPSMQTSEINNKSWIIEPQIDYAIGLLGGNLQALLGSTFQHGENMGTNIMAYGLTSDELLGSLAAARLYTLNSFFDEYRYTAVFSRLNYNVKNRYILNFSGRRDGSSRFGAGRRFGNFGAVGAAWVFSEESFIKDNVAFMSFGKLRASYGVTGSDKIGNYQYLETWRNSDNPYQDIKGLYPTRIANPNFRWESNNKLAIALETGFIKDRLLINISYYDNRSSNHLIATPLPHITGFPSIIENFPATVQNSSWEITINSNNIKRDDFSWSTSFNMTIPRNRLLSFPDFENSNFSNQYIIGKPLNLIYAYQYDGVDPQTGLYTFIDQNNDGALDGDDRIYQGTTDPKFYGGLQNSLSYRGLSLDAFFEFRNQIGRNYLNSILGSMPPGYMTNFPTLILDRWQNPGDITDMQRFTATPGSPASNLEAIIGNPQRNGALFSNASFIRLKTLAVSYSLPSAILAKTGLQGIQLFSRAQNLLTFTSYKGSDPEVQNLRILPPLRTFIFGLQVSL